MTIEQPDTVDGIGIDTKEQELVLLLSDHVPWADEAVHIGLLEGKIAAYISYLNTDQHLETAPQAKGLPVRIKLIQEYEPTSSARTVLRAVETQLEEMNITFSHSTLPPQY